MDPKVDIYFAAAKYPEFANWKAEMDISEAEAYVADSKIKSTLHHVTLRDRAAAIRQEGIDVRRSTETVFFSAGHYMAADLAYAKNRFGDVAVEQKALIKNPKTFKDVDDFENWKVAQQISALPTRVQARAAMVDLLDQGFDGVHILQDTPGEPHSESWLAFHPKQVVSLKEK